MITMKHSWIVWLLLVMVGLGWASRTKRELGLAEFAFPFSLYETFITEGKANRKNFFSVKIKTALPVQYHM
jgi:hypothetical protein